MMTPFLELIQHRMRYYFKDLTLLEKALLAGDTNSNDREGNRGMALLGDSLMNVAIISDGLTNGRSRADISSDCSLIRSKDSGSRIARVLGLHDEIKISDRQRRDGPQPTVLKNGVAALIGAVWQDSGSFVQVQHVMDCIGVLNHAQYNALLQSTMLTHDDIDSALVTLKPSQRTDLSPNDLMIEGCDDYYHFLQADDRECHELFPALRSSGNASPSFVADYPSEASSPHQTPVYTPPSSPESLRAGNVQVNQRRRLQCSISLDLHTGQPLQPQRCPQVRAHAAQNPRTNAISKRGNHSTSDRRSRRMFNSSAAIEAYFRQECEKESASSNDLTGIQQAYGAMIAKAPTDARRSLVDLIMSFGDSTALFSLKGVLQGIRAPQQLTGGTLSREMTVVARVQLINQSQGVSTYHRLLRWLHIIALWQQLNRQLGGNDGGFVNLTPANVSAERGAPRSFSQAELVQKLSDQLRDDGSSSKEEETLCRLAEKLSLMTSKWGDGVLLLLGDLFTETRLLTRSLSISTWKDILNRINDTEGARLSSLSEKVMPILQEFRQGDHSLPKLWLECTEDDQISSMCRLSSRFDRLLEPYDGATL